mmetsp:Transcript_61399/g.147785  ORF Transcript_61399/g.147785 Transcript_61399/m.147785 type:complete len:98 (-) Transcript_61399:1200-1493(-)
MNRIRTDNLWISHFWSPLRYHCAIIPIKKKKKVFFKIFLYFIRNHIQPISNFKISLHNNETISSNCLQSCFLRNCRNNCPRKFMRLSDKFFQINVGS